MRDLDHRPKILSIGPDYDAQREAQENTLGRRLREARQEKGLSLKATAEELSYYHIHLQASAVSKWEQGTTIPNAYQLFALCRLFGIEDGIRYFSGPLHREETALNEQGLKKVEEYREDLAASGRYSRRAPAEEAEEEIERPVFSFPVSAGTGNSLDGDDYRIERFRAGTVPRKADFALTVSGDSMMPNYTDGQMVWVQETPELFPGEIGIFLLNGSAYMKMYTEEEEEEDGGRVRTRAVLVSLNRAYRPIPVGEYDELRILGRVLTR